MVSKIISNNLAKYFHDIFLTFSRFEDFWTGFDLFGDSAKRTSEPEIQDNSVFSFLKSNSWLHGPYLRIWKRSLDEIERRKRYKVNISKITKREVILPSFGIAGDIVNDMATTLINVATIWKYQ